MPPVRHVLSLSTLYPNPVYSRFGTFVARSLEALARRGDWRATLINPIGMPPLALGRYRPLADLPSLTLECGITVHRPRFTLIPRLSARLNAAAIARAAMPLVQAIHADAPIDVIDAQFFFPDGPAAAAIARAMGLPLSIKARGNDITLWGQQSATRRQILDAADAATGLLAVSRDLGGQMARLGMAATRSQCIIPGWTAIAFGPFIIHS
jgi:hypothetical protein